MATRRINVVLKKISEIIPYARNNMIHPENQVKRIAASIKEFGFKNPVIIDSDNIIIAGHARVLAAELLKLEKVPCIIADDLTPEQIKAYRIADNKLASLAEWNEELLSLELSELKDFDIDFGTIGFDDSEVQDLIDKFSDDLDTEGDDDIPEDVETITELGDLWELGEHRLLCGDSTRSEDVDKLMNGQKADMVFTDPPYGVAVNQGTKEDLKKRNRRTDGKVVQNDDLTGVGLYTFLLKVFQNINEIIKSGGALYICHAESLGMDVIFRSAFSDAGFKPAEIIIWVKDMFAFGRQDYHWRHEPIIYGWKKGAAHTFYGGRKQDTVWEIPRPKKSEEHPTMKPIELIQRGVENNTKGEDIILDTFLGSGSTLIACEKTNRICYGMELHPHYCDVTVNRYKIWCEKNNKTPMIKLNGKKYGG